METLKICPNCRKPLPPDVPLGLCPECLIKSGFPTESGTGVSGEAAGARFVPPPVEEIARLFPHLEILDFVGKGGMGAVYKARQPTLDRLVALKVLPPAVASDSGFAERFMREARALARLSHPNIVAVHDFGKAGQLHYLLMEFVDGTNLRDVERTGKMAPEQALVIVPKICEALQYAHDQGVVHRDIKPENILLDKRGRMKIADFGIAKMVGQGPTDIALTGAKDVVGTPHYMAPEQIERPQTVDHRADIYSLGVVFYEMLTGELPLGKFAPPSKKVQVDVRLDEVVLHTLEKEPSRRYQQASQVKTDVETITGTPPAGGRAAMPPAFSSRTDQNLSDKTILPAFLLAFFFGVFGPHRFYVGKTGTAFLQLGAWCSCLLMIIACATTGPYFQPALGILLGVTVFGCIIWATVDWILILCKAFTDGQGRRITYWLHPQTGEFKSAHGSAGILPANAIAREPAIGRQNVGAPGAGSPPGPPSGGSTPPTGGGPPLSPLAPGSASPFNTGIIVAPAVGLMIAALWKLLSVFNGAIFLLPGTNRWLHEIVGGHFLAGWGPIAIAGIVIFKLIPALFILFGAFQMLQLRSYAWSIAAGILAIVSCSLISLPIGIWALIILGRQDVRNKFAEAARNGQPKAVVWPWVLGAALVVPLVILILFTLNFTTEASDVTVSGVVTDAVTGKPIAGARVDDNRYGTDTDKPPAQAWTDAKGHYKLNTQYEEHTIAASAPGYASRLSLLRTKVLGTERKINMDFELQPEPKVSSVAVPVEGANSSSHQATAIPAPVAPAMPPLPPPAASPDVNSPPTPVFQAVRIDVGSSRPLMDHDGHLWLPDQGFADGQVIERPQVAIVNTKNPELYRTERYGMTSFSYPVPNGKYLVKLHFAESYEPITGPGRRIFTYIVEGHQFKDFDIWSEAGGAQRACVRSVKAEVNDGMLNINFIPERQNTEINGIEILPVSSLTAPESAAPASVNGHSEVTTNLPSQNRRPANETTDGSPAASKVQPGIGGNDRRNVTASRLDSNSSAAPPDPVLPAVAVVSTDPKVPSPMKSAGSLSKTSSRRVKILGPLSTSDPFQQDFSRTLPLTSNGRFQLDNVNGRIEVAGWDRNEVSIKALKHGRTRESVDAAKIRITSSPNEIAVHTELPSTGHISFWSWLWGGRHKKTATVDYAIQVPRTVHLQQVSSVNGRVEIRDISGDIGASTVNGAMDIENADGSLRLSTVNGRIKAELDSLDTGQTVSLSTVNGRIEAILPSNANAKVSASTVNGGIHSDFSALIVKRGFPLGGKLKGTLGHGGATVTASSVNGRINFRRGKA